jgi:hypothetical protein
MCNSKIEVFYFVMRRLSVCRWRTKLAVVLLFVFRFTMASHVIDQQPTRVLIAGHSYVRRFDELMERTDDRRIFWFDTREVEVTYLYTSGATNRPGRRCAQQLMQEVRSRRPDVVYFHIDENDIA